MHTPVTIQDASKPSLKAEHSGIVHAPVANQDVSKPNLKTLQIGSGIVPDRVANAGASEPNLRNSTTLAGIRQSGVYSLITIITISTGVETPK